MGVNCAPHVALPASWRQRWHEASILPWNRFSVMSAREPVSQRGFLWHLQPRAAPAHLGLQSRNSHQPHKQLASTPDTPRGHLHLITKSWDTYQAAAGLRHEPTLPASFGAIRPSPSFISPLPPSTLPFARVLEYPIYLLPQDLRASLQGWPIASANSHHFLRTVYVPFLTPPLSTPDHVRSFHLKLS